MNKSINRVDVPISELEVYNSYSYKLMCVMDICTDIDPDYKTYFESSEDMFNNLKSKLIRFEECDNGLNDWYGSLVKFLEKNIKGE